jgi:hypothetical protein
MTAMMYFAPAVAIVVSCLVRLAAASPLPETGILSKYCHSPKLESVDEPGKMRLSATCVNVLDDPSGKTELQSSNLLPPFLVNSNRELSWSSGFVKQ